MSERGHTIDTVIVDRKNAIAEAKSKAASLSAALSELSTLVGDDSYEVNAGEVAILATEIATTLVPAS